MQRLSYQHMQLAMRSALRPQLSQHVVVARRALLSTTSARCRNDAGSKIKTTTTTTTAQQQQQQQQQQQAAKKPAATTAGESGNGNPELPKFSLDGLGVGRNMKAFLIVVLCIFGTMETWFYCKAIWRWWYGEQGLAVTAEDK